MAEGKLVEDDRHAYTILPNVAETSIAPVLRRVEEFDPKVTRTHKMI